MLDKSKETKGYSVFKIYKNKLFWIFCALIPFVLVLAIVLLEMISKTINKVNILELVWVYFCGVAFICMITLLVRLIIYTVIDFKHSSTKGRIFLVILLLLSYEYHLLCGWF